MNRKQKQYDDDDGRVICNMDVDGMRWHDRRMSISKLMPQTDSKAEQMTRSEATRYTWYSVLAGLTMVLVFSATWVLFILFCIHVWFR